MGVPGVDDPDQEFLHLHGQDHDQAQAKADPDPGQRERHRGEEALQERQVDHGELKTESQQHGEQHVPVGE